MLACCAGVLRTATLDDARGATSQSTVHRAVGVNVGRCTQEAPCKSFQRALNLAKPGDVVEVADGFYGCERLSGAKRVTFRGVSGSHPWVACPSGSTISTPGGGGAALYLDGAGNITLEHLWIAGLETSPATSPNVTLHNVHITCLDNDPRFALYGGFCNAALESASPNFTMIGGEIGPTIDGEVSPLSRGSSKTYGDNAVFDGITFNENHAVGSGAHTECLMVRGGNGVTIRDSRFPRCNVLALYFTEYGGVPGARDVLLENNYFGPLGYGLFAIELAAPASGLDNYRIRYNTFYNPVVAEQVGKNGSAFIGNLIAYQGGACATGFVYEYNVFGDDIGRKCGGGTNVVVSSSPYTCAGCGFDTASGRLNATSAAIGKGDPADAPEMDIEGDSRSIGPVDAGADQTPLRPARTVGPFTLYVSGAKSRRPARVLRGSSLRNKVYVFVSGNERTRRVSFYIDDRPHKGRPNRVAVSAPFDMGGRRGRTPLPLDIGKLKPGRHTVTAVIELDSGKTRTTSSMFSTNAKPRAVP